MQLPIACWPASLHLSVNMLRGQSQGGIVSYCEWLGSRCVLHWWFDLRRAMKGPTTSNSGSFIKSNPEKPISKPSTDPRCITPEDLQLFEIPVKIPSFTSPNWNMQNTLWHPILQNFGLCTLLRSIQTNLIYIPPFTCLFHTFFPTLQMHSAMPICASPARWSLHMLWKQAHNGISQSNISPHECIETPKIHREHEFHALTVCLDLWR